MPSAAAVSLAWPAEATAGHSDEIDRLLRQQKAAYDLRSYYPIVDRQNDGNDWSQIDTGEIRVA